MEINIKQEFMKEESCDSLDSLMGLRICEDSPEKFESDTVTSDLNIEDITIKQPVIKSETQIETVKETTVQNIDVIQDCSDTEIRRPMISSDNTANELSNYITTNNNKSTIQKKCTECSLIIKLTDYKQHILQKHPSSIYCCNDCDYTTVYKIDMGRHCKIHNNIKCYIKCNVCSLTFKTLSKLKLHLREHTKEYNCSNCSFVTQDICHLEQHLRMHAVEEPYSCDLCAFKTPWKRDFEIHVKLHDQQKSYSCDKCEFKTLDEKSLQFHMTVHFKIIECSFCMYQTVSESLFEIHMKRHTNVKSFKCNICDSQFAWDSSLKLHLEQHLSNTQNGLTHKIGAA